MMRYYQRPVLARGVTGWGFPILIITGVVLKLIHKEATIRELYEISELGKPKWERRALRSHAPTPNARPGKDPREIGSIFGMKSWRISTKGRSRSEKQSNL